LFMDSSYRSRIIKDFGIDDCELVLAELESISLKHVMANSQPQLDTARSIIISNSKGNLDNLGALVELAKIDIRDILVMASNK